MSEFVNTVDVLGDDIVCDRIITRTLTEYADNYITFIGAYALYSCSKLKSVDFPNVTSVDSFAFNTCSALKTVNLPVAEILGTYVFYGDNSLEFVNIPLVKNIGKRVFMNCDMLESIELRSTISIDAEAFRNCSALKTVILRSGTMCEMVDTNVFTNTAIANATGYIYVPSILVESYAAGTNWSVYSDRIRAIEDYPDITGG